jgi:TetR/AcrR family transcriptional regulator, transcriptional repressor for nem operon
METQTVRDQLIENALTLMMTRGYNGFSYRDLSERVGVKTSSIHYYFPKKEDLALEAVNEYSNSVLSSVRGIDASLAPERKLERYAKLFGTVMGNGDQICLCGMLASDIESLPDEVREAVQAFFKANESWLAKVLSDGQQKGTLRVSGKPESAARALYAAFQGGLLTSRLFHQKARLDDVVNSIKV